jgi:predicted alpha/beta hydrolase family esterase
MKGYQTLFPQLPTIKTDNPSLPKILAYLTKLNIPDKDTIVITHSLGSLVAFRLAEKQAFKKLIVVAAWDYNDLCIGHKSFWVKPLLDHAKIRKNVQDITVIHSGNDPYVTANISGEMSKRLGAKDMLVRGAGHFAKKASWVHLKKLIGLV